MKHLFTRFLFLLGIITYLGLLGNRSGSPAGRTGAPGETTCGTTNCHNANPNTGSATINFTFDEDQTAYQLGATHTLSISIDNAQAAGRNGFEIVALDAQDNNIGEWLLSGDDKRERTGNSRNYITQTTDGSAQNAWEIDWQAPASDAGTVTFYLAVNDANNNGGRSGDDIYITSLSVDADLASSIANIESLEMATIYPNPVKEQLNLNLQLDQPTYLTGTIRNSLGQTITQLFQSEFQTGTSLHTFNLPTNLAKGYYFLVLQNAEGGMKSITFIKK